MGILKRIVEYTLSLLFPNNKTIYLKYPVSTIDETDKWFLSKHPECGSVSPMHRNWV